MPITEDPNDPCLLEVREDGQQVCYLVLSEDERAKGFIRPPRRAYKHVKCGSVTTMGMAIAETYASKPTFYNGTFCVACSDHFHLRDEDDKGAFLWEPPDGTYVGD